MMINKNDIKQISEYLEIYDKILIFRHQRPDLDAIGSQMGLYYILKEKYPEKEIYAIGYDDVSEYDFIAKNIALEDSKIKNSLIFILDTANVDRIEGKYKRITDISNKVIKIDHHPNLEPYGHINLVFPKLSSTSELVFEAFITELQFKCNKLAAKALFSGIYTDTGGFSYSNTSSRTFEIASLLVKEDFEYEELILNIKEMDEELIRILGWMYSNIKIDGALGVLKFNKKVLKENNFSKKNISSLVGFMGVFKTLEAWILMVDYDNFIRVNLRSKRDIDVSKIAINYEGGGHKNASGARVYSWDEADRLVIDVKDIL